jgi:hypothetical protein
MQKYGARLCYIPAGELERRGVPMQKSRSNVTPSRCLLVAKGLPFPLSRLLGVSSTTAMLGRQIVMKSSRQDLNWDACWCQHCMLQYGVICMCM